MGSNNRSHKAEKVIERMGEKLNRQMVTSLAGCVQRGGLSAALVLTPNPTATVNLARVGGDLG